MQNASTLERYMLDLINEERTSRGLNALKLEVNLNQSAADHSQWMLQQDVFSHTGVGGSSSTDRIEGAGFDLSGTWRTAENIAWQSERGASGVRDDVSNLHTTLFNSPSHRVNILNPELEYVGIGIEVGDFTNDQGRTYDSVMVTQNFGSTDGSIDLDTGTASSAQFRLARTIDGTTGNNTLLGTEGADVIRGFDGNDRIMGDSGDDRIDAGSGNDRVYGGAGNDTLRSGAGNDAIGLGGGGRDWVDGGSGTDRILYVGNAEGVGVDLLTGKGSRGAEGDTFRNVENATGSKRGDDYIVGTFGANDLRGLGGDDVLRGRDGDDMLRGGNGQDWLEGQAGNDRLLGGRGADEFHFNKGDNRDVIIDFQNNVDTIELDNFNYQFARDALSDARQVGDHVLFDFGGGDRLLVKNINIDELANDLVIV